MFTGIITDIGTIKSLEKSGDLRVVVQTAFDVGGINIGASIAHNGVCLTVTDKGDGEYSVEASDETLACTNLGDWQVGDRVNLERSLKLGDELGGHLVYGHVDGLTELVSVKPVADSHELVFAAPDDLKRYIAGKGSVTLNGVSLTVNNVDDNQFSVNIIVHTWEHTNLSDLVVGDKVNFEVDMLARYVERLGAGV